MKFNAASFAPPTVSALYVFAALLLTLSVAAPADAASFRVCADAGARIEVRIAFQAGHRHEVRISDEMAGRQMSSFANLGSGNAHWSTGPLARPSCFVVSARHKANNRQPWTDSAVRSLGANRWGFEDGDDDDFDDVTVDVVGAHGA